MKIEEVDEMDFAECTAAGLMATSTAVKLLPGEGAHEQEELVEVSEHLAIASACLQAYVRLRKTRHGLTE